MKTLPSYDESRGRDEIVPDPNNKRRKSLIKEVIRMRGDLQQINQIVFQPDI
jgi:hypothetical protein